MSGFSVRFGRWSLFRRQREKNPVNRKKTPRAIVESLENRTLLSGSPPRIVNNSALTITSNTVYSSITGTGSLTIGTPTTPAVLQLANGGGLSQQNSITINPGSELDLGNNTFIINYGSKADPISTIQSYVQGGYNNGAWNGSGIVGSVVQSADAKGALEGVGYADGAAGVVAGLNSGQIKLMPPLLGDVTLAGTGNFGDLQVLDQGFGRSGSWDTGNFDFNSTVNFGDFQAVLSNFGQSMPSSAPTSPLTITEAQVSDGTQLQIVGSQSGDHINISQSGAGITILDAGFASQTFAGTFASILVTCGNGSNYVSGNSSVTTNLLIHGGTGNDTLIGGAGSDQIWGGGGMDSLVAGSGNDTIVSIGDSS